MTREGLATRGVMIHALDPDPVTYFQIFGDSGFGFGSSKKWKRNTIILALAPDLKSDFTPFGNFRSGYGPIENWNHDSSNWHKYRPAGELAGTAASGPVRTAAWALCGTPASARAGSPAWAPARTSAGTHPGCTAVGVPVVWSNVK